MNTLSGVVGVLLFLCVAGGAAQIQLDNELHVRADTPVISVEKREAGSNFIRLPTITYELAIDKRCGGDLEPAILSLSVADTRRSFNADTMSKPENLAIRFAVPAAQIGPIAVENFCVISELPADENETRTHALETMTVPAVLSLQASLLCANETESQITYASASLDVELECGKPEIDDSGVVD